MPQIEIIEWDGAMQLRDQVAQGRLLEELVTLLEAHDYPKHLQLDWKGRPPISIAQSVIDASNVELKRAGSWRAVPPKVLLMPPQMMLAVHNRTTYSGTFTLPLQGSTDVDWQIASGMWELQLASKRQQTAAMSVGRYALRYLQSPKPLSEHDVRRRPSRMMDGLAGTVRALREHDSQLRGRWDWKTK